jgi:excisionase family DNA binding protein
VVPGLARLWRAAMKDLLTTGEAAALLGVSKPTVVRAIQRGLLRPALVTPGQHRRFRREDLLAFRSSFLAFPAETVNLTGRAQAADSAAPAPERSLRAG